MGPWFHKSFKVWLTRGSEKVKLEDDRRDFERVLASSVVRTRLAMADAVEERESGGVGLEELVMVEKTLRSGRGNSSGSFCSCVGLILSCSSNARMR